MSKQKDPLLTPTVNSPEPLDPRWPRLLVAARVWRSTGTERSIANLRSAIDAFDPDVGSAHDDPG